jgi:hypothetical protein
MTLATRVVPSLAPLLRAIQGAGLVVSVYQTGKNSQDEATINGLLRSARQVHEALTELKWKLGDAVDYPFEHAQENVTLGRYALPIVPDAQAVGDLLQVGGETQERVLALFSRILGRLAAIAEAVELGIGLKPLEVPEA